MVFPVFLILFCPDDSMAASDDLLDLNAPYDPEKEALKESSKPKKGKLWKKKLRLGRKLCRF